ncbi:MAG: ribonuclease Z [Cyanobacteria bacterium J06621_3]
MQITFLGTSSGVPTRSRNVSSVALRLPQRAEVWLFDCGEGTQHQFLRSDFKSSQIRRIFVTHMHGDHIFGLPGLLASCGMAGTGQQQIDIYGPPDLGKYLEACRRYSKTQSSYPIKVHITEPGTVYEDDDYKVVCQRLKHRIPAHGYRIVEKDRTGHFDVKRAATLGIPPGPVYGKLKRGEVVTLDDGRRVNGAELCGPTIVGRKLAYCTDTVFCESAIELADQADVLIHEATFSHQDAQLAYQRMHSTSTMAAQVALAAEAKQLIMTHFSPRYAPGNVLELSDLLEEAKAIFPNTLMAKDFFTYDIERRSEKDAGKAAQPIAVPAK